MSVIAVTVPIRTQCVGCKFFQWSHPNNWLIGTCINKQSTVRRKDPCYGMDKRCAKWQPKTDEKKGGEA